MIDDIRRAIHAEYRWLSSIVVPNPLYVGRGKLDAQPVSVPAYGGQDNLAALLRIEIDHDRLPPFLNEVDGIHNPVWDQLRGRAAALGPPTLEGVPLYEVGKLPDPGWRVVNAIRALRG